MTAIYLVRHGQAAASWADADDPGLNAVGVEQAERRAGLLAPLGPLAIVSSPMRRAQETAAPLAQRWESEITIDARVSEIPSPGGVSTAQRGAWLADVMQGRWSAAGPEIEVWRRRVGEALLAVRHDAVVFSHFVAINVAVGLATDRDHVVLFRPGNTSCTILEHDGTALQVVELGQEDDTVVR